MPSIEVTVSEGELAKWAQEAALTGESLPELIRQSVNKHLASVEEGRAAMSRLDALIERLGGHRDSEAPDDLSWWEAIDWESDDRVAVVP